MISRASVVSIGSSIRIRPWSKDISRRVLGTMAYSLPGRYLVQSGRASTAGAAFAAT
jgi:hypothetical protein